MKNLLGLLIGIGLVLFMTNNFVGTPTSMASPLGLPAVQRTAIYAPADATRTASNALSSVSAADAQAREAEAARVYAQAQHDQQAKLRVLATQQAAQATQIANDTAVSNSYRDLMDVSFRATTEAITRTIAVDREQYNASIVAIRTTAQAATDKMMADAQGADKQEALDYFWTWVPTFFALMLAALAFMALWYLVARLAPQQEQYAPPPTEQANPDPIDPPLNKMAGIVFDSADPRTLLYNIVLFSGRHLGWYQNRVAGTGDIGSSISGRSWDMAIKWGKEHYGLVSQTGQGTYVPGEVGSLADLLSRLRLDPVVEALPDGSPAPK